MIPKEIKDFKRTLQKNSEKAQMKDKKRGEDQMSFYAIRMLDHKTVNIVKKTWPECSAITKGHSAEFKKFNTLQEVENYFN